MNAPLAKSSISPLFRKLWCSYFVCVNLGPVWYYSNQILARLGSNPDHNVQFKIIGGGVTASFASFAGAFLEKDPGRGKKGSVFSAKKAKKAKVAKVAKKAKVAIAFLTFDFALLD